MKTLKKNLNDWDRPLPILDFPSVYGWELNYRFKYLTEGQQYRYNVLIPNISRLVIKYGLSKFTKMVGYKLLVETFQRKPDELFTIFGEFNRYRIYLHNGVYDSYRPTEADVYYYNTFPLFYVDERGLMMVDNSLKDLFVNYFRMPESYYGGMLIEYAKGKFRERVLKINFCDLSLSVPKMESMHISYRDERPFDHTPTHRFRY